MTPHADSPNGTTDADAFDFYVEQLECYLDGELDRDEAAKVRAKLSEEPAYAASLARLQSARRLRIETIGLPGADDDQAAARLTACAANLCGCHADEGGPRLRISPGYRWGVGLAAAASLAVGFLLGSLGGLDFGDPPAEAVSNPVPDQPSRGLVTDTREDRDGLRRAVESD